MRFTVIDPRGRVSFIAPCSTLEALVAAFGDEIQKYRETHPREEPQQQPKSSDEKLLNGPQLPEDAGKQDDIDALLN